MDAGMRPAVEVVQGFARRCALVIGDAILDTYVDGVATRVSREAPIPVIVKQEEERCPGGAANTAANFRALGAEVMLVSRVGTDASARYLRTALRSHGVDDRWLVEDPSISTPHKLRILANDQYIARVDEGGLDTPTPESRSALVAQIEDLYSRCDLVVISDYGCGTVDDAVLEAIQRLRDADPRMLVLDARQLRRVAGIPATLITPSVEEARDALADDADDAGNPEDLVRRLADKVAAGQIALTMASDGVIVRDDAGNVTRLATDPVARAGDVGAGDSFTAAMALAMASGASAVRAAEIGIDAASIACTMRRTAVVPQRELVRRVSLGDRRTPGATPSLKEIAARVATERYAGRRIVFTNGVFDLLHAGHVHLLERARQLGDVLVVGVNSDASVRRIKGPKRPVNGENDRLALVTALHSVDYALIFDEQTPAEVIRAIRPDVHVKGGDYTEETLPEIDAVREVGARVEILPLVEGRSTTGVIARIASRNGDGDPDADPTA